jgi:ABC-2 type transport system permease protein
VTARAVAALTRASWHQAKSYRLSLVMQVFGLMFTVIPIYFIANALQPTMAGSISAESQEYFSFMLVGSIALMFVTIGVSSLQGTIATGISNGYFESLLMTRTPIPALLVGLTSYPLVLASIRASVMVAAGWILGAPIAWSQVVPALLIILLLFAVHWGIGLIGSGLIMAFRTAGPLTSIVTTISIFFGGVYYPVSAIPSWLKNIADATPLAYGLRALRRVLLLGDDLSAVGNDLAILAAMGVVTLIFGAAAFSVALGYAKKAGTLSTY